MIVGLSLILALLSYLIYRRLFSADGGTSSQSKTLPMWPFLSTFIKQPSNPTPTPTPTPAPNPKSPSPITPALVVTEAAITVQDFDAPDFGRAPQSTQPQQQQPVTRRTQAPAPAAPRSISLVEPGTSYPHVPSPEETTPKALALSSAALTVETSAIPQISLLADSGRGDAGARVQEDNSVAVDEHEDGKMEVDVDVDVDDDDIPPSFPSLNSAQRASGGISSLTSPLLPSTSSSSSTNIMFTPVTSSSSATTTTTSPSSPSTTMLPMPPPPIPIRGRNPKANTRLVSPNIAIAPPPSTATRSRLAAVGLGASGVAAGTGLTLPNQRKSPNSSSSSSSRKKVVLEPGHSPLDWARLQHSGVNLRGLPHSNLVKVSPSMLAAHAKSPEDIWTALNGRVYNITTYLPFHPGGERDLLRGAGKDCTKLFNATHPWVNVEGMLAECLIGIYITEEEEVAALATAAGSALESVD